MQPSSRIAIAFWGSLYDDNQLRLGWLGSRRERYTLLSCTENLLSLRLEIEDEHGGPEEITLSVGPGTLELERAGDAPERFAVTRGQFAWAVLENKLFSLTGDALRVTASGVSAGDGLGFVFPEDILAQVVRPWARAALAGHAPRRPRRSLFGRNKPWSFERTLETHSVRYADVFSRVDGGVTVLTELPLDGAGPAVEWRLADQQLELAWGDVERTPLKRALTGSSRDKRTGKVRWIARHELSFPLEQISPLTTSGAAKFKLFADDGSVLELEPQQDKGYRWLHGVLDPAGELEPRLVGLTHAAYQELCSWASAKRALAVY